MQQIQKRNLHTKYKHVFFIPTNNILLKAFQNNSYTTKRPFPCLSKYLL